VGKKQILYGSHTLTAAEEIRSRCPAMELGEYTPYDHTLHFMHDANDIIKFLGSYVIKCMFPTKAGTTVPAENCYMPDLWTEFHIKRVAKLKSLRAQRAGMVADMCSTHTITDNVRKASLFNRLSQFLEVQLESEIALMPSTWGEIMTCVFGEPEETPESLTLLLENAQALRCAPSQYSVLGFSGRIGDEHGYGDCTEVVQVFPHLKPECARKAIDLLRNPFSMKHYHATKGAVYNWMSNVGSYFSTKLGYGGLTSMCADSTYPGNCWAFAQCFESALQSVVESDPRCMYYKPQLQIPQPDGIATSQIGGSAWEQEHITYGTRVHHVDENEAEIPNPLEAANAQEEAEADDSDEDDGDDGDDGDDDDAE